MSILQVVNLKTHISATGGAVKAVDDISFTIEKGEVFGLVGESGSGKSMTALSILRLLPPQARIVGGQILFDGCDLAQYDRDAMRSLRGAKMAIVFQDPSTSLNPVFTIGYQLEEALLAHQPDFDAPKARTLALSYLDKVHVAEPERIFHSYPHQLSGGTKQRVMIAMALLNSPELVILDEPTTALDVTIQAQILELLEEIIKKRELSILFISHDFGVISRMCDRVGVMHEGKMVESGSATDIINDPEEVYTKNLLDSVRVLS
jgi:ABC-type dipeptide/oligopeptide/nickel transport system ATPase component